MKASIWRSDWFAALLIVVLFIPVARTAFVQGLERWAYDIGVRSSTRDPGDSVVVIAIDDKSIDSIGRWPWSRNVHAQMIDLLHKAGAKVIGFTVLLSEPQIDPGLKSIRELKDEFDASQLVAGPQDAVDAFRQRLTLAEAELDTDSKLAESLEKAGNVILPVQFVPGPQFGNPDQGLPDFIKRNELTNIDDPLGTGQKPWLTIDAVPPISELGTPAKGLGHILNPIDVDGAVREEWLVIDYYGELYPSQALMIAAASLNLAPADIKVNLADSIDLGGLHIKTDPLLSMRSFFYRERSDGRPAFSVDSFAEVLKGEVIPDKFRGKIVLIGATAFGVGTSLPTPVAESVAPALIMAHNVASILNEDFFVTPTWAGLIGPLAYLLIAAYLIAVLPKLKAASGFIASGVLLVVLFSLEWSLMKTQATWVQLMTPMALLFVGHLLITTKRFLVTETGKMRLDIESAERNKQLGLTQQQQGQLDAAFDSFRRCPPDEQVMGLLWSLASDYESKRKFAKAHNVYQYMYQHAPTYKDLETKMRRAKSMEETVMLGGGGSGPVAGTLILDDGTVSKPMLGRYQVEKELGKGAMGVVYLGKDPKINRTVAIKTMALSQEFEASELDEVKSRFFREAETAGRLTHPNIVTIYDAGEEHDLAYIAMEFLEGHDLTAHTREDNLLSVPLVMGIIYKAALALDYAHKQNVVHRDIKPANIMYEPQKKQVKLTDFGIARITDSSRTKTGMVLGTPSYMSPEQVQGKKVDGRSDLFSLGVTLYHLLTGKLPFAGDSMATLMYKIANDEPPDILSVRPDLARVKPCLAAIVVKALAKDLDKRYQTGAEMARDLQQCAKQGAADGQKV
jgi:serine/threonine-protein kinase